MVKLHGEFKRQKVATISILEGPDKGWTGKAVIYKNQKDVIIAKPTNTEKQLPSGKSYYFEASFKRH